MNRRARVNEQMEKANTWKILEYEVHAHTYTYVHVHVCTNKLYTGQQL